MSHPKFLEYLFEVHQAPWQAGLQRAGYPLPEVCASLQMISMVQALQANILVSGYEDIAVAVQEGMQLCKKDGLVFISGSIVVSSQEQADSALLHNT